VEKLKKKGALLNEKKGFVLKIVPNMEGRRTNHQRVQNVI
jgi:hypothetical protein